MKRRVNTVKSNAKEVIDEKVDQVSTAARGAAKYVAEAPGKIENASRHGIGSLLNGIAKRASDLAKRVDPKGRDEAEKGRAEKGLSNDDMAFD